MQSSRVLIRFLVVAIVAGAGDVAAQSSGDPAAQCQLRRLSDSAYAGRCSFRDTTILLLAMKPPAGGIVGHWSGLSARVRGRGGDTSDVIDWTAFQPSFLEVGARDGLIASSTLPWNVITETRSDSTGALSFVAHLSRTGPATDADV